MRYCPAPSVTAVRTFSMRAGLDASTVTPGSTAPDSSLTVPVRVPCANARDGSRTSAISHKTGFNARRMGVLLHHGVWSTTRGRPDGYSSCIQRLLYVFVNEMSRLEET